MKEELKNKIKELLAGWECYPRDADNCICFDDFNKALDELYKMMDSEYIITKNGK